MKTDWMLSPALPAFYDCLAIKTLPNPKPGQRGNHCQLQEVFPLKDSHASLRLIAHPYHPLLPPIHRDRSPPNQSCIPHTILGVKGTLFLRVTRLKPRPEPIKKAAYGPCCKNKTNTVVRRRTIPVTTAAATLESILYRAFPGVLVTVNQAPLLAVLMVFRFFLFACANISIHKKLKPLPHQDSH